MVVSMTACGNSDAGGSKDSAKNNGNGDEPVSYTHLTAQTSDLCKSERTDKADFFKEEIG